MKKHLEQKQVSRILLGVNTFHSKVIYVSGVFDSVSARTSKGQGYI
jgi:hypothetical protein